MNIPTELLRTFVTITETGGFSKAGTLLGRSQPAISLQIKRLEELVGSTLLTRKGRVLEPTEQGDVLFRYAQQILKLNDELAAKLIQPSITGHIKLGIPNEFAVSYLPQILGKFAQTHRDVTLEVTCALSTQLSTMVKNGDLDIAFNIQHNLDEVSKSDLIWYEDLVWVTNPDFTSHMETPVPIVTAPKGCEYRKNMINALDEYEMPWRIVYTSTSYGGIRAAVMAGLGVTVLARSIVPDNFSIVGETDGFPELPKAAMELLCKDDELSDTLQCLVDYIRHYIDQNYASVTNIDV